MDLLTVNRLAGLTITETPAGTGPARLTDQDPGPQYVGAAQQITLDVDLGATPPAVAAWGLLHHNVTGVTVALASGASSPPGTAQDSVDPLGADVFRLLAAPVTARYWRWTIPALAGSTAPLIGELLLGAVRTITDRPTLPTGWPAMVGNVARDRSPAGVPWAVRRGPARARLAYEWMAMPLAQVTVLTAAYADCGEGSTPVLLRDDASGAVWWTTWTDAEFAPEPIGGNLFHVRTTFEEIPL